jgi:hypothetical protein
MEPARDVRHLGQARHSWLDVKAALDEEVAALEAEAAPPFYAIRQLVLQEEAEAEEESGGTFWVRQVGQIRQQAKEKKEKKEKENVRCNICDMLSPQITLLYKKYVMNGRRMNACRGCNLEWEQMEKMEKVTEL